MGRIRTILTFGLAIVFFTSLEARADNGSYTDSGGVFTLGYSVGKNISVQGAVLSVPQATLSFLCPITSFGAGTYQYNWQCGGGSITVSTPTKSLVLNGTFISGTMKLTVSGGGRGGHITYWYQLYASFTGTVTSNGITQAANGSISQVVKSTTQVGAGGAPVNGGSLGWNSAYSPVVVGDPVNSLLFAADNITGANLQTYGSYGTGVGQFSIVAGLAQDATGRIYVTDSGLDRLVRIDNLSGKNWAEFGTPGSGNHQFNGPIGVAIDSSQKIWVADAANNRIVRFDDMTGTNWVSFGAAGSGPNQFNSPSSIAFDSKGRIYIADSYNNRIVRFDDLKGSNWTQLTQVHAPSYVYNITLPVGVAVNSSGQIYIALSDGFVLRVNDMTGANASVANWGTGIWGMSLDKAGTLFVTSDLSPGLGQAVDAIGTGYFASALNGAVQQPRVVLATVSSSPTPPDPVLSTSALAFGSRNVGEPTAAQRVVLTNIGAQPLTISPPSASPDYKVSNGCAVAQPGGASCTIDVQFDPTATGSRPASLAITSNGAHRVLDVALSGFGTQPRAIVLPGTLNFDSQKTGTASGTQTVTLANTGTGPLTISSITASGDFTQTNNCGTQLIRGNGCTLQVVFHPSATGLRAGSLTISDDAIPTGTRQTVTLQGTGTAAAPAFTLVPENLQFPDQQIKTTSAAQVVTLTNSSGSKALLGTVVYSSGFTGKTTCGSSLAAGASCTFSVQFTPITAGPVTGSLTIPVAGQPSLSVGLSGTGSSASNPVLSINPGVANFGAQVYGDQTDMSLTVKNTSGLPIGIAPISVTGDPSFSITANTCPAILAGYASCSLQITFVPSASDPYASATLTLAESSGAKTVVAVSGEAVSDTGN